MHSLWLTIVLGVVSGIGFGYAARWAGVKRGHGIYVTALVLLVFGIAHVVLG